MKGPKSYLQDIWFSQRLIRSDKVIASPNTASPTLRVININIFLIKFIQLLLSTGQLRIPQTFPFS